MLGTTPSPARGLHRRVAIPALTTLLVSALAAPAAYASTTVDTPADGTPLTSTTAAPSTFAVSGTATVEPAVTLMCARKLDDGWHYTALSGGSSLAVSAGHWSAAAVEVPYGANPCRLLALPAGVATPASSVDPTTTYAGPRLRSATVLPVTFANGSNAGKQRDYAWDVAGLGANAKVASIGSSGVSMTQVVGTEPSAGPRVFFGANAVAKFAPGSPTAGTGNGRVLGLRVDGVNTWLSNPWSDAGGDATPLSSYDQVPTVATTTSVGADQSVALAEHDALRQCSGPSADPSQYPLGGFTCPNALIDPGVKIDVTTTISPEGTRVLRDWALNSTDGQPHTVDLVLVDYVSSSNGANARAFRAGSGGYSAHEEGDDLTSQLPASGPWSITARRLGGPSTDSVDGFGAITFATLPSTLRFTSSRQLTATYHLAVPATGPAALRFIYSTEASEPAIDADVTAAEAALRGGSGGELTPTPTPTPLAGDTQPPGANTIPGVSATPTPTIGAAGLVRSGKARLKGRKLTLGWAVRCPASATGAPCQAVVRLAPPRKRGSKRAPKPFGKATVTVKSGQTVPLVLTVKATKAALRRAKPTLTAQLSRPGARPVTATQKWRF